MNVWIMNLNDNRDVVPEDLSQTKFDYCMGNSIIGIGWVGDNAETSEDTSFLSANKAIDSFEIGDLVWVKNPYAKSEKEEYYICRIISKAIKTDDEEKNKNDIGKFCKCEYIPISTLPVGIENREIVARHTIQKANGSVSSITEEFFNSRYIENDDLTIHTTCEKKSFFTRKTIKIISVYAIFIISIILVVLFAETDNKQNQVQSSSTISTDNTQKQESSSNIKGGENKKDKTSLDVQKQDISFTDIYDYTVKYSKENNIGEVSEIIDSYHRSFYYYDRRIMVEGINARWFITKLSYHLYPELEWELSHDESKLYAFIEKMLIPFLCLSEEDDTQTLLKKILTGERKSDYYNGDPIDVAYIYHGDYWDIALVSRVSDYSFGDSFYVTANRN